MPESPEQHSDIVVSPIPPDTGGLPAASRPARKYDRSIIEGPLGPAIWRLAWPTMITNVIGGLQAMVDHIMVGHYVDFRGNAAIGVSSQVFLVVCTQEGQDFSGGETSGGGSTNAVEHCPPSGEQ